MIAGTDNVPAIADRAAGALLGLAAGHALGLESVAGAAGLDIVRRDTPFSPHHADVALALLTADSLKGAKVDVQRMAHRWVEWLGTDGRGASVSLRSALELIRSTGAPPESGMTAGVEPVLRAIPIALKVHGSPANLLSAPLHLAALTHPDPRAGWASVAVGITLAHLLAGERDFIGDVIEALRVNSAPDEVLEAVRMVPKRKRAEWPVIMAAAPAVAVMHGALWMAYHEPLLERGASAVAVLQIEPELRAATCAVATALLATRDTVAAIPERWKSAIPNSRAIRSLGANLVGRDNMA